MVVINYSLVRVSALRGQLPGTPDPSTIPRGTANQLCGEGAHDYDVAVRRGEIVVDGPMDLSRALPRWFMSSPMARFVRECRVFQKISA